MVERHPWTPSSASPGNWKPRRGALAALLAATLLAGANVGAAESTSTKSPKKMLTSRYSQDFLLKNMVAREDWKPFPAAAERDAWKALLKHPLNQRRRDFLVEQAEALLGKPQPALSATGYMEYARNGNRSRYQDPYFQRRENLSVLALAECFEGKGRFLDDIVNTAWAICEESTWCVPAHATREGDGVLHRLDIEGLDLFACETAMSLAQAHYLLRPALDAIDPIICDRIRREVERRIVGPYAAGDDFGRSGWLDGHNNWSPWCASNVMGAAFYLEDDPARLAAMTFRLMEVADRFIDRYGDDGGCDEGPGYWNEAAGALVVFLELLHSRTNGAVDIYAEPKIAAMGRYIELARLDGPWFANFADADALSHPHPAKVYRYGERTQAPELRNLALLVMREWRADAPIEPPLRMSGVSRAVLGLLMEMFWIPADAKPVEPKRTAVAWLPDVQTLFARESERAGRGLVLAAKGGHNAESHNHNDVGHFMLYLDGQPAIVDLGRETYTRQTFSGQRYELWFTRGAGHNAPVVNGVEQLPGRQYHASDARFERKDFGPALSLQLATAYPEEAGLKSLRREFELHRESPARVVVRDALEFAKGPGEFKIIMYAAREATEIEPGRLRLTCWPRELLIDYDAKQLKVAIEPVKIEDEKLQRSWGGRLCRLTFSLKSPAPAATYEFRFTTAQP